MSLKTLCLVSGIALTICACSPAADDGPPPPPPLEASGQAKLDLEASDPKPSEQEITSAQAESDNAAGERTANIDWASARRDMASQSGAEPLVSIASAGGTPPPVPILLPTGGPVSVATNGGGPRFKQTSDGYYAVYKYDNYDVIVNGTNEIIGTRPEGAREEAPKFTGTAAGAQVALSRYGADYLIEFECYTINPQTGTCIEAEEALGVAESLVIRGTR